VNTQVLWAYIIYKFTTRWPYKQAMWKTTVLGIPRRFEVLTGELIKIQVFLHVMQCQLVNS